MQNPQWLDGQTEPVRSTSPSARAADSHSSPPQSSPSLLLLTRVFYVLAFLLLLQYMLPYLIERCEYALVRGRQRAEYEVATERLGDLPLDSLSKAYQMISQHIGPSVVHIEVTSQQPNAGQDRFVQYFGKGYRESEGQGSGVIVDEAGYVLTNYHVIEGGRDIRVSLSDGRRYPAELVGNDIATDIAVLKIDAGNLTAARWGDSDALQPGAMVWAVGSPFGLQRTITFGIVSAKHRSGGSNDVYQDFMQTDAAVNPGNSGGPLVDARGEVVGINTAILGDSYQGISFAIPSNVARNIYERLRATGKVARGWLGVFVDDTPAELVEQYNLVEPRGTLILDIADEAGNPSPARLAGLQKGDIVLRWNETPINKPAELIRAVAMTEIGSTANVDILRNGQPLTLQVKVAERSKFVRP